jgi:catechol 2,3-dioxygenase-like lactoylglutathione lyase family enzyme
MAASRISAIMPPTTIRIPLRCVKMWGHPPFSIADNYAIEVRNLSTARQWYQDKLGLREARQDRQDDSGRPFVDLHASSTDTFLTLVELPPGANPQNIHVIFFAKNLGKTHQWLKSRGVAVEQPTTDSGGNRLFDFHDLEGNKIEVSIEPG